MSKASNAEWKAVRAALNAGDMPLVVKLLHPLAVSDPQGVTHFLLVGAWQSQLGSEAA